LAGIDIDLKMDRYVISSVKRRLRKYFGRILESIHGVGYQIVTLPELTGSAQRARKSATRRMKQAYEIISCTPHSELRKSLNDSQFSNHLAEQGRCAALVLLYKKLDSVTNQDLIEQKPLTISADTALVEAMLKRGAKKITGSPKP
jgi:hypothetical protein